MKILNSSFAKVMLSAIVTAVFTFIASYALYKLSNPTSSLRYEILPVSNLKHDSLQLTIVSIRIFNDGKKECDNVDFYPSFGDDVDTATVTFEKSSGAIQSSAKYDTLGKRAYYNFSYLNPGDQVVCSFLLNGVAVQDDMRVHLRSRGVTGRPYSGEEQPTIFLFVMNVAMLVLAISITVFIIFHQRRVIRYQLRVQKAEWNIHKELRDLLDTHNIPYDHIISKARNEDIAY